MKASIDSSTKSFNFSQADNAKDGVILGLQQGHWLT